MCSSFTGRDHTCADSRVACLDAGVLSHHVLVIDNVKPSTPLQLVRGCSTPWVATVPLEASPFASLPLVSGVRLEILLVFVLSYFVTGACMQTSGSSCAHGSTVLLISIETPGRECKSMWRLTLSVCAVLLLSGRRS